MSRRPIGRDTELELLAVRAEAAAEELHAALEVLRRLRESVLANIEDLGGDRDHNWDIQADLGNAETAIWAASQKARQIFRHARAGLDNRPVGGV